MLVMWTEQLQKVLSGSGIDAFVVHPGGGLPARSANNNEGILHMVTITGRGLPAALGCNTELLGHVRSVARDHQGWGRLHIWCDRNNA
jgi:hypothetical protein